MKRIIHSDFPHFHMGIDGTDDVRAHNDDGKCYENKKYAVFDD